MSLSESIAQLKERAKAFDEDDRDVAALLLYKEIVRLAPDDAFALMKLAESLHAVGRSREAEAALVAAYGGAPIERRCIIATRLAVLYHDCGQWEKAEAWFQTALSDPEMDQEGWAWIYRGANLAKLERFAEAESHYQRAAALPNADVDEAWLNIGLLRRALEDFDGARHFAEKALALDPDYRAAQVLLQSLDGLEEARIAISSLNDK